MPNLSLLHDCTLHQLSETTRIDLFDCGDDDLNEFFRIDALPHQKALIGKSYYFTIDEGNNPTPICAFTVSNDALRVVDLPNARKKKAAKNIPGAKRHYPSYPAVKIGRLGVHENYKGNGIGWQLMTFIKGWFADAENKTGCRFVVVDAYNNGVSIGYYERNEFKFLFHTIESELAYVNKAREKKKTTLDTRIMYFDLLPLKSSSNQPYD